MSREERSKERGFGFEEDLRNTGTSKLTGIGAAVGLAVGAGIVGDFKVAVWRMCFWRYFAIGLLNRDIIIPFNVFAGAVDILTTLCGIESSIFVVFSAVVVVEVVFVVDVAFCVTVTADGRTVVEGIWAVLSRAAFAFAHFRSSRSFTSFSLFFSFCARIT
jgi:hypothetical protein